MPVIGFGDGDRNIWKVARWAYRGLLDHTRKAVAGDRELVFTIDQAQALDGLHFDLTDDRVARPLLLILVDVADRVLAGELLVSVDGRLLDDRSQVQFRDAVKELRVMLKRYGRRWQTG